MLQESSPNRTLKNREIHSAASEILLDLVSTPSVSGNEHEAAHKCIQHAITLGFEAHVDEVNNAIAHRGAHESETTTHIVLLGHIDTVPGLIPVRIENGILHGRGAVDAKGPLVAMLVAASKATLPEGVRLTVVGAAGEEAAGSIGARHLVNQWSPDACIIGEPSGIDGVTLGYKGRLLVTATAVCANSHSAGKDPSASDVLHSWWASVVRYTNSYNNNFNRVYEIIQASILDMQSSGDGIEQHAVLRAGFRLPIGIHPDSITEHLNTLASDEIHLQFDGAELAHTSDRNDPVVRAISGSIRSHGLRPRPKLKTGTSDMNVVAPIWKCPIAAYGTGDSTLDHTPKEHLVLQEFDQSIRILTNAIENLVYELGQMKTT